jgi:hypothetical protein
MASKTHNFRWPHSTAAHIKALGLQHFLSAKSTQNVPLVRVNFRLIQIDTRNNSRVGADRWEGIMTAFAQAISRATGNEIDAGSLGAVLIFCSIGFALSLLAIKTYGLDLSYSLS